MRKYKVGQTILLPAIKREHIRARKAVVVTPPTKRCPLMVVRYPKDDIYDSFEVPVSPKTGRILAVLADCAVPSDDYMY